MLFFWLGASQQRCLLIMCSKKDLREVVFGQCFVLPYVEFDWNCSLCRMTNGASKVLYPSWTQSTFLHFSFRILTSIIISRYFLPFSFFSAIFIHYPLTNASIMPLLKLSILLLQVHQPSLVISIAATRELSITSPPFHYFPLLPSSPSPSTSPPPKSSPWVVPCSSNSFKYLT